MVMYKNYWNAVRESVLDWDLACVSSMLALCNDDDYKFISEFELFLTDIACLHYSLEKGDKDSIVKDYEQFRLDLQLELSTTCSSKLPEAEACAIATTWLNALKIYTAN